MDHIDRIAPTQRPNSKVVGRQSWLDLLFLHWPVSVADLRPLIPASLDIDTFEGQVYVGLVPFAMSGVRPSWLPKALAFEFLETNLRTYVHIDGRDPGVYFFSLEAASWLAVKAARVGWGLPYFHARMTLDKKPDGVFEYHSERRSPDAPRLRARYRQHTELGASQPDTLEHFLFERYLLHVERRGALYTGQVHHVPYPVWTAELEICEQDLTHAAGLPALQESPALCHFSPGVDVEIFGLKRQPSRDRS